MSLPFRLVMPDVMTIYTAQESKARLISAVREAEVVELDLSRVDEMDTAGFQLMVLAKRESLRLNRRLRIVGHSPAVQEVIEFFNMAAFFGDPLVIDAGEESVHG